MSDIKFSCSMITGCAGFIGFHISQKLLKQGYRVVGIDNLNDYYDVALKKARLKILEKFENFSFHKFDLEDLKSMENLFKKEKIEIVVNLAAQAGVRYSLVNPHSYVNSNIVGFVNVLECCRHNNVKHLVFASSSSVYGSNKKMPFSVHDNIDHPVSLYAATKKANELMAHTYSHLYNMACTGLRFFTVYGPWGRPDMALFLFTKAIYENKPIKVFNHGDMQRDFTYIDDIVEGIARVMVKYPEPDPEWDYNNPDPGTSYTSYRVFNIGNNQPVQLSSFIELIEKKIGKKAIKEYYDMQPGDVQATYANIDDLYNHVGFKPATDLDMGIGNFITWYNEYFNKD